MRAVARLALLCLVAWVGVYGPGPSPAQADSAVRLGGTGAALGLGRALSARFGAEGLGSVETLPRGVGSTGAIRALLAGALDVAVTSRPPSAEERAHGASETLIGHSPVLFVTSRSDGVKDISSTLVVRMFGLEQLQWPNGDPAYVVLRSRQDSDLAVLAEHIAGLSEAVERGWAAPGRPHAYTAQDNLEMATRLPNSLAAVSLTQLRTETARVTPLSLDGVAATLDNLRTRAYRAARPFYLVVSSRAPEHATAFVRFTQSAGGRQVLTAAGVLPHAP